TSVPSALRSFSPRMKCVAPAMSTAVRSVSLKPAGVLDRTNTRCRPRKSIFSCRPHAALTPCMRPAMYWPRGPAPMPAAHGACARIGGVRQLSHRHLGILDAEPKRCPREGQADLPDPRVVGVEHGLRSLGDALERRFDRLRDLLQLAVAVELVAKQVQDDRNS